MTKTAPMQTSEQSASPVPTKRRGVAKKVLLAAGGGLVAVAAVGYVVSGPYRTLKALQTSIAFNDANGLAEVVDFPTLRENLKLQLRDRMTASVSPSLKNGPLAQVLSGIASGITDTAVESLITPAGLSQLVQGASIVAGQLQGQAAGTLPQSFDSGQGSFESLTRFDYRMTPVAGRSITLVLGREGLNWKLSNVLLPAS